MTKFPKMSESDVDIAVQEIDAWAQGLRNGKLTWFKLERITGFSRQTLCKKEKISTAYGNAINALKNGIRVRPPLDEDFQKKKAEALQTQLKRYERLESEWLERWARIAYWARGHDLSIEKLDKPLPPSARS